MLSHQQKLTKRLISLRKKRKLSQQEVAAMAGFRQPYLAQIETGVRPISGRALALLENVYGQRLSEKFWKGIGRRGRPKLTHETRLAMREFGQAVREFWGGGDIQAPAHPQFHQVRRSSDPLWPMALHLSSDAREEVRLLESLRAEDELFWRQFNSLRFDSWSEKRLLVRVGLLGGQLLGLRLQQLGCSVNVVDGVSGGPPDLHRGFVLKGQKGSVLWCPQVSVKTSCGIFCVDNLLVVSAAGRRLTVAVEVDGAEYHGDLGRERWRDRALGIPVLHLDAGEFGKGGLVTRILRWAHAQLQAS